MSYWALLPPDILVSVFELLNEEDRYSASMTCKAWQEVSKAGCLWRKRVYVFRGYCQNKDKHVQNIQNCVHAVGHYIRELQLVCQSPNLMTAANIVTCVETLFRELAALENGKTTLKTLVIKDLDFDETWRGFRTSRDNLVYVLTSFILTQRKLKTVDMSNAFMTSPYAFTLMEAIMRSRSIKTLQDVNIANFFSPTVSTARTALSVYLLLGTLIHTKRISVNLSYLQDRSLLFLCSRSLQALRRLDLIVSCKHNGDEIDSLSTSAWRDALEMLPDLKVTITFDHWPSNPWSYVNPAIPLVEFHLRGRICGSCKASYAVKFQYLLEYLVKHFSTTLTRMSLYVNFGKTPTSPPLNIARDVVTLFPKCPRLKVVHFSHALVSNHSEDGRRLDSPIPKEALHLDGSKVIQVHDSTDLKGHGYTAFVIARHRKRARTTSR